MNDKYALFVWSSYGLALCVLVWNLVSPILRRRQIRLRAAEVAETFGAGEIR